MPSPKCRLNQNLLTLYTWEIMNLACSNKGEEELYCSIYGSRSWSQLTWKDDKSFDVIRWHRHTPLSKLHFHISDSIKTKSSSTWVIRASLCEGPIFYFYVESVNLFPSIISKHLSCCDPIIYVCWCIRSLSFIFPCVAQCFYLNEYTVESFNNCKEIVMIEHVISAI